MKIIALDVGDARIGIAISDVLGITANPLEVYKRRTESEDIDYIVSLASKHSAGIIVVGLPVYLDGNEGERAVLTRAFADKLGKATDIAIDFEDESLTTVEAEEALISKGIKREERKKIIDMVAAAIILNSYLNRKARQ
jgi:putative Holliday junction resolvase